MEPERLAFQELRERLAHVAHDQQRIALLQAQHAQVRVLDIEKAGGEAARRKLGCAAEGVGYRTRCALISPGSSKDMVRRCAS